MNGAAVLSYPSGEFAVIVSEYDHTVGELDHQSAIDHARVVSNCFRNSTVLPFKFGTIFDSDDALRHDLQRRARLRGQALSWEIGTRDTLDVIRGVAAGERPSRGMHQ